ncbi:MAG: cation diffusion facilitator family transporter [Acidimicrobiales bacterium]
MDRSANRSRRLVVALLLNIALVAVQVAAGLRAHSMGLLADAGHNLTDAAGIALALLAVRWAMRPRSPEHSFGYHRGTILAALANAATIGAVTVVIVIESVRRLVHPVQVHGGIVIIVAALALVLDALAAIVLRRDVSDLNMRAATLHMAGDALASLAVLAAGIALVVYPSAAWADPASSLVVSVLIVIEAWSLLRSAVGILLESSPPDVDLDTLESAMRSVEGVAEVHDLHVWSLSSEVRALSAHVVVSGHPSLEEAHCVGEHVKSSVSDQFAIAHATVELECEPCVEPGTDPCLIESSGVPVAHAHH